jgi:ABC-type antimicrobial peptide transport system permease subunit
LVLGQSLRLAAIGAVAGAAGAQGMAQLAAYAGVPYSWRDFDFAASIMGVAVVLAAAASAAWLPSRRAARVEPVVALRCD